MIHVVDPGVGGPRKALAVRGGDGRLYVGPDNGLLSLAWERCGGVELAVRVEASAPNVIASARSKARFVRRFRKPEIALPSTAAMATAITTLRKPGSPEAA